MPKVTIAIPAYKGRFLGDAMASALAQDYKDIELVVVDDCSPDDVEGVVRGFDDSRIRYFRNGRNLGGESPAVNWNVCLDYASGDYFVLLCDDDTLDPRFVSGVLDLAARYPDCGVFRSPTSLVNAETGLGIGAEPAWPEHEDFDSFARNVSAGRRHHTISEFMVRTDLARSKGGYVVFPAAFYSDDASVLRFADDGGVCSLQERLVTFRKSADNISSRSDSNVMKSRAALEYYRWLSTEYGSFASREVLRDRLDFDLVNFFMWARLRDSLRILALVPSQVWGIRQKAALMRNRLFRDA